MNGHFVISLDFEIHWGVFDQKTVEDYQENLKNTKLVVDKLIALSDRYNVKLTFSTVGFLFAENKKELLDYSPNLKPSYLHQNFSPYRLIEGIGNDENDDTYHYALSSIQKIKNNGNHEIGTHTFCHYYCHEHGQTVEQFEEDIKAAIAIASSKGIELHSIVFPRNMIEADKPIDQPYLDVCSKHGITSFRGKEKAFIYNIHTTKFYHGWYLFKILRLLDTYFNVTGANTYDVKKINERKSILNFPSSRLLRPYSNALRFLEPLKLRRIKKAMKHAAIKGEMYHLWWHPHNFGSNMNENLLNLEQIFKAYSEFNKKYDFQSETMTGLASKLKSDSAKEV